MFALSLFWGSHVWLTKCGQGAFLSQCPLLPERLIFIEGRGGQSDCWCGCSDHTPMFQIQIFVCSHGVYAHLHKSAKREELKIRVTSTKQKKNKSDNKSSRSLFILIKQDSATSHRRFPAHAEEWWWHPQHCSVRMRGGDSVSPWVRPPSMSLLSHLHWRLHDTLLPRSRLAPAYWHFMFLVLLFK